MFDRTEFAVPASKPILCRGSPAASGTIQKVGTLYLVNPHERSKNLRDRIRRAIRRLDAWTVEAFNPVYPRR